MAINWAELTYLPQYNVFARPITVYPVKSQPNVTSYDARGIYNTVETEVVGADGSIFSDQKTILDIYMPEFAVLPVQQDIIDIPEHLGIPGGMFEVQDYPGNAVSGGEMTLTLKKVVTAKP